MAYNIFSGWPLSLELLATALLSYPLVTSLLWSVSGLYYLARRNRSMKAAPLHRELSTFTVIIPFHAEFEAALATAVSLQAISPAPEEIIIVDDGSPNPIAGPVMLPPKVRIVRLARNRGKAGAMQHVLPGIKSDVIVCMDADTKTDSVNWLGMLANFEDSKVGGVTGKIRPTKGGGLVEWFQTLDYLTVIAVIKSAESAWGGLLTVSGAFVAYRAQALRSVGGWNTASSTEDIDVSWRLQTAGWRLVFDSDWIARVEMAPSVKSLWRQRQRWSSGLGRALRDHGAACISNNAQHLPIVVLTLVGLCWLGLMLASCVVLLSSGSDLAGSVWDNGMNKLATIMLVGLSAFYTQLATAIAIDGRNLLSHWRSVALAPLYPLYFWCILLSSFLAGFPKGFARLDKGTWNRTARRIELAGHH